MQHQMIKGLLLAVLFVLPWASSQAAVSSKIEPALLAAVQQAGMSDFAIVMQEQADLSAAAQQKTRIDKTRTVVAALKATAGRSQKNLLAELAARGIEHRAFWIANAITGRGTLADLQALAARPDVAQLLKIDSKLPSVLPPTIARLREVPTGEGKAQPKAVAFDVAKALGDTAEDGIKLINAPAVWAMGFKGQGVVVADHDIGVMWDHPALKKNYRGWDGTTASHAYNWRNAFPADPFCTDPVVPCDSNGHGTHTTGTMVGVDGDNQIGVAPDAKWMACRSLLDPVVGVGTLPTYMDCMEWQLAPYPNGNPDAADPAMSPDVISNSWGCLEACAPPLLEMTNEAIYAAGQVQVVSAGNDGQGTVEGMGGEASCSTLAFPLAVYESSFTVGANDKTDQMASFSSLGPVLSDASRRLKPNITAPGVATRSSWNDGDYNVISGTSMAGPHVAGMVALLMSAEPRLIGRVADVRTLVERTANPTVGTAETASTCGGTPATTIPNNIFGHGRIDALAAVLARPQLEISITTPASVKVGELFTALVKFSQPATGKIDATEIAYKVSLSGASTRVDCGGCRDDAQEADRVLEGVFFESLAPGASKTLELDLIGTSSGDLVIDAAAEAAQISPGAMATGKTMVSSASPAMPTPGPATPVVMAPAPAPVTAVADSSSGRFGGGAFGGLLLAMLALGAALRRRRS